MRQLMLQLREGATPPGNGRRRRSATSSSPHAKRAAAGRRLELELQDEPLATRGHEDRLERVLGHLVQNALDATPPAGASGCGLARHGGQAPVEVGDTGHGMSEEFVRDRLFKPFQQHQAAAWASAPTKARSTSASSAADRGRQRARQGHRDHRRAAAVRVAQGSDLHRTDLRETPHEPKSPPRC
jgi:hypothetical protein